MILLQLESVPLGDVYFKGQKSLSQNVQTGYKMAACTVCS